MKNIRKINEKRFYLNIQGTENIERIAVLYKKNAPYFISLNDFLCVMLMKGIDQFEIENSDQVEIYKKKNILLGIKDNSNLLNELVEFMKLFKNMISARQNILETLLCRIYNKEMNDLNGLRFPESVYSKGKYDTLPKDLQKKLEGVADDENT